MVFGVVQGKVFCIGDRIFIYIPRMKTKEKWEGHRIAR